jgi:hypothetical protein
MSSRTNAASPQLRTATVLRDSLLASWPALLVAFAFTLPFIDKAFTVDDPSFLRMAEHMLADPLHPTAFDVVFHGRAVRASQGVSGPVMPALLIPAVLADGAEWLAHLTMLAVFMLGIAASAALALRLGQTMQQARVVAFLTCTSPAVLACSTTSMPDVPAMSFAVLGVERLLAFRDHASASAGIVAALALALAVLSRVHVALLLACLVPLVLNELPNSMARWRSLLVSRSFWLRMAPLAAAVLVTVLVMFLMKDPDTGDNIVRGTRQNMKLGDFVANLASEPSLWFLSFPLGLFWTVLHGRRMLRQPWCWLGALAGISFALARAWMRVDQAGVADVWDPWFAPLLWEAPIAAVGMAMLTDIVLDAWQRRDPVDIALAGWLLIALPVAFYPMLVSKYLVASAPAMAVLMVRNAYAEPSSPFAPKLAQLLVVWGVAFGWLIAKADADFADIGRQAGQIAREQIQRGERVWYDGGLGFAWYAYRAGARPVAAFKPQPTRGDVVVSVAGLEPLATDDKTKHLIRRFEFNQPGGRVWGRFAGFWFNRNQYGLLPWQWGRFQMARIEVWRID